jgi:teichuronic acid biosynthesis glycosyltransferase TuaH
VSDPIRDLVICSLERWDQVWRRNQFLTAGLLDRDPKLRVLFVEPSADPLHDARSRHQPQLGGGLQNLYEVSPRLYRLQLTKWLPRVAGPFADRHLRRGLLRAARQLGMVHPTLWINDPSWAPLTIDPGWPAIYDITDDWLAANRANRQHRRLVTNENVLMSRCREVVVCSPGLQATKGRMRDVRLIPNAVDVARFSMPQQRPTDLPMVPIAVYVGTLHEDRLDVSLCQRLGPRLAAVGAALVLVGPNALAPPNSELLRSTPGVVLLGARGNESIPGYLQHADALIVPHVVDDFTESLDPIKMYEYQIARRPIVATPVAGFRDLAGLPGVHIAEGDAFVDAVIATVTDPSPDVGHFAVPDWSERVAAMDETLLDVQPA